MDSKADRIVTLILDDMLARGGLDGAWDDIDEDTQEEIRSTWISIVQKELSR